MLNHNEIPAAVTTATAARDAALAHFKACAKRVRLNPTSALIEIYEDDLARAFDALDVAEDALRLVRDGYAHTYPHPAALAPHGRRYPVR